MSSPAERQEALDLLRLSEGLGPHEWPDDPQRAGQMVAAASHMARVLASPTPLPAKVEAFSIEKPDHSIGVVRGASTRSKSKQTRPEEQYFYKRFQPEPGAWINSGGFVMRFVEDEAVDDKEK